MLHLAGLFTHLFDPTEWDKTPQDPPADQADLSDFERRAIGQLQFSREGDHREEPRFATMVMPPHL